MISTELSIVLGKQFHFLWCSILTLPEHYEKNEGGGGGAPQVKRATEKEGHLWRKSTQVFFYPLRPIKLKKHERLVNSKISTGPHYRAWTIWFNWS